jgi:predicted phage tail protein
VVRFDWTPPVLGPLPTGFQIEGGIRPGEVLGAILLEPIPTVSLSLPQGAFYIRVRTLSGADASTPSNEVLANVMVSAAPSPPEKLLGVVDGDRLGLTWRNTFEGGEPTNAILDVTGAVTASLPVGLTESLFVTGIPTGQYTLAVRTTNASGASAPSNALTLTFPGPCSGAPFTPVDFVAVSSGNRVYLRWDAAAGGAAPAAFLIHVTGTFAGTIRATGRAFDATAPAGTYSISVSAENSCGTSAPTASTLLTVP